MTNTKDIILKLKRVREEKNLSLNEMVRIIEENGDFISKSTLSRLFADGSEEIAFRYEATVKPVAYALLGVENIDEDESLDVQTMKSVLQYQMQRIRLQGQTHGFVAQCCGFERQTIQRDSRHNHVLPQKNRKNGTV